MNKSTNNLIIENLKETDIDKILYIEKEQNISITSKKILLDELTSNTSKYYVLKHVNKIIGYINISILVDNIDINSIVIKKEYQRKGLATYLLEYIFNLYKEQHIDKILLEVRASNIAAQNLYIKLGFKKINTRKKYYPDNFEDAYIYEKIFKN